MSKYLAQVYAVVSDQGPGPILWFDSYDSLPDAKVAVAHNVRRLHHLNARIPSFSASFLAEGNVIIVQARGKRGSTLGTIELVETSRD